MICYIRNRINIIEIILHDSSKSIFEFGALQTTSTYYMPNTNWANI